MTILYNKTLKLYIQNTYLPTIIIIFCQNHLAIKFCNKTNPNPTQNEPIVSKFDYFDDIGKLSNLNSIILMVFESYRTYAYTHTHITKHICNNYGAIEYKTSTNLNFKPGSDDTQF